MKTFPLICYAAALTLFSADVQAAFNAADVASNYAGLSTYLNSNRGTGWSSAFTQANGGGSGSAFLASSGQIDTNGVSFGVNNYRVQRYFGGGALSTAPADLSDNQIFSFRLQPGTVVAGGVISLSFVNSFSLSTGVSLSYTGGNTDYTVGILTFVGLDPTSQTIDTGIPFSSNSLMVAFSTSGGMFKLSLTPAGGSTTTITNSFTGAADGFVLSASANSTMYFNNLAVIPEPKSWTVIALGLMIGLGWRMAPHGVLRSRKVV